MVVIVEIHANKKHTVSERNTGMRKRLKNFGRVRGVVCNLKEHYTADITTAHVSRRHIGTAKHEGNKQF